MDMTPKDEQILQYACENFSCKICNSILIQCVTLSCGHHYCNYCLELLYAGMPQCPQCSSPIHRAQPNNSIDRQVDNLIHSCSEPIQKAYTSALNSRFQKALERSKTRQTEGRSPCTLNESDKAKLSKCLDGIRNTLLINDLNPLQAVTKNLKSARSFHNQRVGASGQSSSRPRNTSYTIGVPAASTPNDYAQMPQQMTTEIDTDKVNMLFGIYDHVLSADNEPNQEMGAGDFARDQDFQNVELPILDGLNNFTKRGEVELETLIKETDDIIRLDDHIQKWTNRMKDALGGNQEQDGMPGMGNENFEQHIHKVDDELWKASNELLQKLQGMQKQRKMIDKSSTSISCPPTPLPRSYKLNFDAVSDDSDAEEYEHQLERLQVSLDNSYDLTVQRNASDLTQDEGMHHQRGNKTKSNSEPTPILQQQQDSNEVRDTEKSSRPRKIVGDRSARRKTILDCMEESGHKYIKENIEFITKMRKYKEALLKIQNREVLTAQEIKELVPTRTFPSDGPDATMILNCRDASTPRRLSNIHHQASRRIRNPSYSARIPHSTTLDRRPMTATYELPPSQQLIHKQIAVVPAKQYLKQRSRAAGALFTAR